MRRRLQTLAEAHRHSSFTDFFRRIQACSTLRQAFLDTMTINVTEMLRNPERFEELARDLLPPLLAGRGAQPFSVWSAGCSYGAEAYSLALLLHEREPDGAHRICGTDVDEAVLSRAAAACFAAADMAQVSPDRRQAHFADEGDSTPGGAGPFVPRFRPLPHLRARVRFRRHDLLRDPYPRAEHHLIVCRNVLIYFTEDAKERIARGFWEALKPGGLLFVGGTERLPDHQALGFELIRPFFYCKPGA